ncbi:glycosyltransferase [Alsobacter sp. R-9]
MNFETSRRLRIALTADPEIPVPPTHYGGIERVIDMLARELVQRGHHVTLFAHRGSQCPCELKSWPGAHSGSRLDTVRNAAFLARHVLAGRFDVVHSFSRIAYLGPILPLPIPKLMTYQREISPRTTGLAATLSRGTLEFSAISRHMQDAKCLRGVWHMVPNGLLLLLYRFQPNVAGDAPFVFLGRIEEIKGPHLAIEIARRTGRRLVIAGNIPAGHERWVEEHVMPHIDGDRVTYVGPVDDAAKDELLGHAAAFLMPILWEEPFGIVMIEAMACGTPVLGLRRGAVPEVVEHGRTGFVEDDVDGLVRSASLLGTLSRSDVRARVERLYSAEAVTDAYEAIYRRLIGARLNGDAVASSARA